MFIFCLFAVKGVLDLPENEEVAIIGTLYKEMKLKPSILAEYTKVGPCIVMEFRKILGEKPSALHYGIVMHALYVICNLPCAAVCPRGIGTSF